MPAGLRSCSPSSRCRANTCRRVQRRPGSAGPAHGSARALGACCRIRTSRPCACCASTRSCGNLTGEQFVNLLAERFAASAVVVGQDFRFGRGGAGSVALLQAAADAGRFALELVPSVCVDEVRVSSSGVRAALASGDFRAARDLLGRAYSMRGRVVAGEKLGRRLGFPTANIRMRRHKLPFTGVYAVRVRGIDGNLARDARGEPGVPAHGGRSRAAARSACIRFFRLAVQPRAGSGVRREDPRRGEVRQPRYPGAAHAPAIAAKARELLVHS